MGLGFAVLGADHLHRRAPRDRVRERVEQPPAWSKAVRVRIRVRARVRSRIRARVRARIRGRVRGGVRVGAGHPLRLGVAEEEQGERRRRLGARPLDEGDAETGHRVLRAPDELRRSSGVLPLIG